MLALQQELSPDYLKILKGFNAFVEDPNSQEAVYNIGEGLLHTDIYMISVEYLKSDSDVERLIRERYLPSHPDLDALLQYPQDSLGYIYSSHMKENFLTPDFYPKIEVKDDVTYITLRRRQTHDILHTVTGFGTDLMGEISLQAFQLAQCYSPLPMVLIAAGVAHSVKFSTSFNVKNLMDAISQGWLMGLKAKLLLAQKWEERWDKPLSEWRAELGVEPIAASSSCENTLR